MRYPSIAALLAGAILAGVAAGRADAQAYPSKPVRLVVPFAAGGSTDYVGRLYAEHLSRQLQGASVIVENKPGAATNIGLEQVARSEPDGHTLLMATSQTMINIAFGPVPASDPFETLAPVALVADAPFLLAAAPDAGIATVRDVVSRSRATPLTIGHAQFEPQVRFLSIAIGTPLDSIPFKGGAPSVMAALGGQVNLVGAYVPVLLAHVKAGKLRGIAVASASRASSVPDVPTFAEQGFPRFTTAMWTAVFAPKGTPGAAVQRLAAASAAVQKDAAFAKSLETSGFELLGGTPPELAAVMRKELQTWNEIAKAR